MAKTAAQPMFMSFLKLVACCLVLLVLFLAAVIVASSATTEDGQDQLPEAG
jgi:hypothetical protein